MDTIFALATVPGKSGVAVIRVSGPDALKACDLFGFTPPRARQSSLRQLHHAERGFLDEALVLVFEAGGSFTGEPVVEFQTHGSVSVVQAVLACLAGVEGYRPAEAGEFTRRALDNGRLDLTQVEALSDLIDAETEMQRRQALKGFSGRLREMADSWRNDLIRAMALLEATMEFSDEEVPEDVSPEVQGLISGVLAGLRKETDGFGAAERIRTGFEVAIIGPPNAGKSTLLNALAGRDAAITSDVAGTTRDVIEVRMDIDGMAVTFLDTAGLRETVDEVEAIGVSRARERAQAADLRVVLRLDGESPEIQLAKDDIVLSAKSDLHGDRDGISGKTGQGVSNLVDRISGILRQRTGSAGLISHSRQRDSLLSASFHLEQALVFVERGGEVYDLAAEEIRRAILLLEMLVGRVDVEHLLDEIFSSFCIGK